MKNIFIALVFLVSPKILLSQTCLHSNLSTEFNFEIKLSNVKIANEEIDSNFVKIKIINKISNKEQEIKYGSSFLFEKTFEDCNSVRSYLTNINKNAVIVNNDFGDLVVVDLNFDGREDFAIKNDSGGNGGTTYNFYIQNENKEFFIDKFLTEKMKFFPGNFKSKQSILTTFVIYANSQISENTFKYNLKTKKWKLKKIQYIILTTMAWDNSVLLPAKN